MTTILIFLTAHWIADFVLQSRRDAEAKSHDVVALIRHVSSYIILMTTVALFVFKREEDVVCFFLITFVAHFITDYFTSKGTAYAYLKTQEAFAFKASSFSLMPGDIITTESGIKIRILRTTYMNGYYDAILLRTYDKWNKIFWSIIGFDQLLHVTQILLTIQLLLLK